ncbi:SDR family oxidoreductase [Homoserinibacter sp. GY 40078]|uniref:SDR family oxidoreductase n=1 Tax=Homoserinibacter sp. GY 40078 TaxID=2603275 RepID=UPI0011CB9EBC|nr:SDR family oxidoreductase [Homoserinibacter sp. GY 40078]TXK19762.1 SDR family oxidoreductase [Homoserinibacter sp. GY 40078]
MRIFVTGATGWIGSASVAELLSRGHEVVGLARSDESASKLQAAGAAAVRGELTDLEVLHSAAAESDGVLHLGFVHDFDRHHESGLIERAAVETIGEALVGSDRPFVMACGLAGYALGRPITEQDATPFSGPDAMRGGSEQLALSFAERGVRSVAARFAATVHGPGDFGFVRVLADLARSTGVAGYPGAGTNHWPAVNRVDAASLVATLVEEAPAGTVAHAVAEEGIETREIARMLGDAAGVPVRSIPEAEVAAHFGWIGRFFTAELAASSAITRERFGWEPTHATLAEDVAAGAYGGAAA